MESLRVLSAAEQVARHLHSGLIQGLWSEKMPGVMQLATELAVSRTTVDAALRQLESEGLLAAQGAGRRRSIVASGKAQRSSMNLRIGMLLHDPLADRGRHTLELEHKLKAAGHAILFATADFNFLSKQLDRATNQFDAHPLTIVSID